MHIAHTDTQANTRTNAPFSIFRNGFKKYIECMRSANSIAQSMLHETLTIEHDIDVFKLILSVSLFLIRCSLFFFFFFIAFAALACNTSTIQSYSLLLVASILNVFGGAAVAAHCLPLYMYGNNFESKTTTFFFVKYSFIRSHWISTWSKKNLICTNIQAFHIGINGLNACIFVTGTVHCIAF